jgi:two-component system, NarL family, response regulator
MAERPPIRVLVADDHQVVRVGLRAIVQAEPDMEVVAEAADAAGAIASFRAHRPDVALLDLRMPGMSGPHVIAEIRREDPGARIIVVTSYDADEDVFRAMQAGARGFLLKDTFTEGILEAIRTVHAGRRLIDPQLAARLMDRISEPSLTAREISVLQLVARGMTNKEIGIARSMGEETVKAHLKHVFAKLDVTDRTEAALLAVQRGLIRL